MAHIVITGANRGIGLELCRHYLNRGDTVTAVCRSSSAKLDALNDAHILMGIDVGDAKSIATLTTQLIDKPIDVLINNAGILRGDELDHLNFVEIQKQFNINSLGPLRVTAALKSKLAKPAKVAIITSRMGSMADNSSGGSYGYRMSKAAVNAAGVSLARDLHKDDVAVAILHPGWVRTDMTKHSGHIEPSESAAGLVERIDELTLEHSGGFWHSNGERLPW